MERSQIKTEETWDLTKIYKNDEDFYEEIIPILRLCIQNMKNELEKLPILKPYSFVLIDEDKETISDLYLVDDDTLIFDDELLKGLDEELDEFLKKLLSE